MIKISRQVLLLLSLIVFFGCSSNDQQIQDTIKKLGPGVSCSLNDNGQVIRVKIGLANASKENQDSIKKFLPRLSKLNQLETLSLSTVDFSNNDLVVFQNLRGIQNLYICDQGNVDDDGLEHFASMTDLRELTFEDTNFTGKGLSYLKGLDKLSVLTMNGTTVNDSAIVPIVENFKNLKQFFFDASTSFSKEAYLELANLLWIQELSYPVNLVPVKHLEMRGNERKQQIKKEKIAKLKLMREFNQAYLAAKKQARDDGVEVSPENNLPFEMVDSQLRDLGQ